MSSAKDGGPAFPQHGWSSSAEVIERMNGNQGMTLRNWFAGMALQGLCSNHDFKDTGSQDIAELAFDQADAMLAARDGKESA